MTLSKLMPGVHYATLNSNGNNVYLVLGKRAAFIDSGDGTDGDTDKIVSLWRSLGSPHVDLIILTHRHYDHSGGAAKLANITGGRIASSFDEKSHIDQFYSSEVVHHVLEHGDLIDLDGALLEILLTPGHTLGSISIMYYEEKVLFTGDTILGDSNTTIMCDQGDMELYLNSLRNLQNYEIRLIAPGHGPVVRRPMVEINRIIEHRLNRERQIFELISTQKNTIDEIFNSIYINLETELAHLAREQIRSHVVKLQREGRITSSTDGNIFHTVM